MNASGKATFGLSASQIGFTGSTSSDDRRAHPDGLLLRAGPRVLVPRIGHAVRRAELPASSARSSRSRQSAESSDRGRWGSPRSSSPTRCATANASSSPADPQACRCETYAVGPALPATVGSSGHTRLLSGQRSFRRLTHFHMIYIMFYTRARGNDSYDERSERVHMTASHAVPDVSPEEWRLRARCRGMDITVFYLDDDTAKPQPQRLRTAKNICRRCPVINECRQYAIHFGEQHGVWGGLTPRELGAARKWSRWQRKPG